METRPSILRQTIYLLPLFLDGTGTQLFSDGARKSHAPHAPGLGERKGFESGGQAFHADSCIGIDVRHSNLYSLSVSSFVHVSNFNIDKVEPLLP